MTSEDSHRPARFSNSVAAWLMPALALAVTCLWNGSAAADFRLCNNTSSRGGIALGYKDAEGWTTEGWWNVSSRSWETLLRGTLVARFYYIYALDYDRGGEGSGQAVMCSRDKGAWAVQRTESNEQPAQRVPGIPGTVGPGGPGNLPGMSNSPGGAPGMSNSPGGAPPGASGLPPAAAPESKP